MQPFATCCQKAYARLILFSLPTTDHPYVAEPPEPFRLPFSPQAVSHFPPHTVLTFSRELSPSHDVSCSCACVREGRACIAFPPACARVVCARHVRVFVARVCVSACGVCIGFGMPCRSVRCPSVWRVRVCRAMMRARRGQFMRIVRV